jgi:hypothetical protein
MSSFNLFAQSKHIEQSTPFENVLTSMKSDSASLFMNCFSERIVDGEDDEKVWMSRLNEGKEKFEKRFGHFELTDFSYEYEATESKLVIYYKSEKQVKMRVVNQDGIWKLDEK